ncbi:hypothetical protein GCM10010344_68040 [Streptomyces bluensis]|nr:hypothetical protein GCM10010344_68040 [Streptomyces bluensis]
MNGLDQIGAPTSTRSSTTSPTADTTAITAIAAENSTSGRCHDRQGAADDHDGAGIREDMREDMREDTRTEAMTTPTC